MNYYKLNMDCMMENRNTLFLEIEKKIANRTKELDEIYSVGTKDGNTALYLRKEGVEYRLNSSYYPEKEAKQWSEQYEINNLQTIIIMFGLGNGLFAKAMKDRKNREAYLFIYEPSFDIFYFVINNYDITDIIKDDRVFLLIDDISMSNFYILFEGHLSITSIRSQIWCIHPKYNEMYREQYQEFIHQIKEHNKHALIVINTKKYFGTRYVENIIKNLSYLPESNRLLDYKEIIDEDIPAIILAAGPSLKNDIAAIKKLKGKAYIFVVDRILDYALENGVEPDFIVSIDPIKPMEYFTDKKNIKIPLLCKVDSNWEILKHHEGKKVIVCADDYIGWLYLKLKEQPPYLGLGNSVATVAFSACEQLGFKVILLAGQDLAYDGEYTHAGGIAEQIIASDAIYVEGIDGKQVKSRWDWYQFLRWYKVKLENNQTLTVIDIKNKGAKIPGTINMTLEEVTERYITKEFEPTELENIKPTFTSKNIVKMHKYIKEGYDELERIKEKVTSAIGLCEEQIKGYIRYGNQTKNYQLRFKRISRINGIVYKTSIYSLLEYIVLAKSTQALSKLYEIQEDEKDDIVSTYKSSIGIYKAILDAVNFVEPLLEEIVSMN